MTKSHKLIKYSYIGEETLVNLNNQITNVITKKQVTIYFTIKFLLQTIVVDLMLKKIMFNY